MADLDDLSVEQLEAILNDTSKRAEFEAEETVEAVVPEPEPEPAAEVEQDTPETVEAEGTTPEPEQDLEKEARDAVIAELEARVRAQESRLGKFAGEADYWRKKAEGRPPEPRQEEPALDFSEDEPKPRPSVPMRRDSTTAWVVTQAITAGANDFVAKNPEAGELQADMAAYLQSIGHDPSAVLESDDPIMAQRETYRVLDEAYWHVKAAKSAQLRADIETRKAEQFSRQKEAKARASVSASGSTQAARPKSKTLDEMSVEELGAILDQRGVQR